LFILSKKRLCSSPEEISVKLDRVEKIAERLLQIVEGELLQDTGKCRVAGNDAIKGKTEKLTSEPITTENPARPENSP